MAAPMDMTGAFCLMPNYQNKTLNAQPPKNALNVRPTTKKTNSHLSVPQVDVPTLDLEKLLLICF
jgi:hypothetical protein